MHDPAMHDGDADGTGSRPGATGRRDLLSLAAVTGAASLAAGRAFGQGSPDPAAPQGRVAPGRGGLLRPQRNQHRDLLDTSGLWRFQIDPREEGEAQGWFQALP